MRRSGLWRTQDRWVGGVAAGVARRLDVDPLLVRGVLVVLTVFGGLGLLLYGLGWALLPEEADGRIHLEEALHGNVDAALVGAIVVAVIGLARPGLWWARWGGDGSSIFFTLITVSAIALVVIALAGRSGRGRPAPTPPTGPDPRFAPTPGPASAMAHPQPAGPRPEPWRTGTPDAAAGQGSETPYFPAAPPATSYGSPTPFQGPPATPHGAPAAGTPWPEPRRTATAPEPYRPARPATPGPGSALVAVVLGAALLGAAVLLLWDRIDPLSWQVALAIGGVVLALLGLGAVIAGALGRRGGALATLGVLLALLVVPATVVSNALPEGITLRGGSDGAVGDLSVAPDDRAEAERGAQLAAGDLAVDLTRLELGDEPVRVPISLGAGDISVTVPNDADVRVEIDLGVGEVRSITGAGWSSTTGSGTERLSDSGRQPVTWLSGMGLSTTLLSPGLDAGDAEELLVVVDAGASTITIEEER